MKSEPVNTVHPAKASLSDLSASRIVAVLFGSLLGIFGFFSTLIWISRMATVSESGVHELPQLIMYGLAPFIIGIVLCWAGFRKGYEGASESRLARAADKGLALLFGFIIAAAGIVLSGFVIASFIFALLEGKAGSMTGIVYRGAFSATILMLGIVILRKAFRKNSG